VAGSGKQWIPFVKTACETQSQASQLQACLLIHTKWNKQGVSKNKKSGGGYTVKNAVELFFAFHPDVEKIQYH
jgi:hypothetical protein